ncbi:MAG: hypothetical protein M3Y36_00775 [Actinomycetota bacterium]|nr:hypothetical protein [Actinomycetota bacterium]
MGSCRLGFLGVVVLVAVTVGACSSGSKGSGPPPPAGPGHGHTYNVTSYNGCKGNGTTDCAAGMQAAIGAAQAAGGGTVYFPAGKYLNGSGHALLIGPGAAVTFTGAGATSTSILARAGSSPTLLSVKADHVTVGNLTFDSSMVHGGKAVVADSASFTTIHDSRILGGPGTSWPLRVNGGHGTAKPTQPTYATGNVVDHLYLHDTSPGQDDGLDFSFQQNATISNVQHLGSRLGMYVDRNVTINNYTYTPDPTLKGGTYGFYITPPSFGITINDFTSSGYGGKIGPTPRGDQNRDNVNVTINHEVMTGKGSPIFIGDVTNLVIRDSTLGMVRLSPKVAARGTIENTSYAQITHNGPAGVPIAVTTPGDKQTG